PPAASGFIEAELAWRILFEELLGLAGGRRDPEAVLEWSLGGRERFAALPDEIREGLCQVVAETSGALAGRIFEAAAEGGKDVLAVGLVARVLYGPAAAGDAVAIKATGKLESYLGGGALAEADALGWAAASEAVIERRLGGAEPAAARPLVAAADKLLAGFGATERAQHSRFLGTGYEQRLARFAGELTAFVDGKAGTVPPTLPEAAGSVRDCALARLDPARCERVEMALRLARWLAAQRTAGDVRPGSFVAAARAYRRDGGYVDQARTRVWDGDTLAPLGVAYTRLSAAVGEVRESWNRVFGELFANWHATGSHDPGVLGVEQVLDRVVVPLAKRRPVLLAVIDGMGVAVFRELQADLVGRDWIEIRPPGEQAGLPVIAAVPPVSEFSRASLLCGELTQGKQAKEKKDFARQSGLVAAGEPPKPPVVFHKGELRTGEELGLSRDVVDKISDRHRRVVGVVINAVDDHLAKGEQIRVDWTAHRIRPLEELLEAAWAAGRAVVLVSDHGHVLEHQSEMCKPADHNQGDPDRWRRARGEPGDREVLLEGPRVLAGRVIVPWSEQLRYGHPKNGYHGGAAPQEVVVPLAVFVPSPISIVGWPEAAPEEPYWWVLAEMPQAAERPVVAPSPPRPGEQQRLFPRDWIGKLLESEELAVQRAQAARTRLSDDRLRRILEALDECGGKITRTALSRRLGVPLLRINGIVSALRRVLNVEGYAVLSVDEASDTVELNRRLLDTQFGLKTW
ncbi:MAG: BREX-2 system phosphatase PglZ, partial [bacterium]|nr:BREX-2 system phosphatase PglZ [bacterium]